MAHAMKTLLLFFTALLIALPALAQDKAAEVGKIFSGVTSGSRGYVPMNRNTAFTRLSNSERSRQ